VLELRPAGPGDEAFLGRLAASRWAHLAPVGPELVGLQDRAQRREYAAVPGSAGEQLVVVDGEPAGRVWWADGESERHVLDVVIAPELRGRGIGSAVVEQLVVSANGKAVRLQVEHSNVAWRAHLERAGFVEAGRDAVRAVLVRPGTGPLAPWIVDGDPTPP